MGDRNDDQPTGSLRDAEVAKLHQRFVQDGDLGALGRIIEVCGQEVFKIAVSVLRQEESARDVVQDVFRAFIRYCRTIDRQCVRAWLRRVSFRKALHELKRQRKSTALLKLFAETYVLPNPGKTPLERLLSKETGEIVQAAIRRLGKRQRACAELYLKGMDPVTAATMLGISVSTYHSNCWRAWMNLRKMLKDSL